MPMTCLMPHCRHRRSTHSCSMHSFPRHEPILSLWTAACRRFYLEADGTRSPWSPGRSGFICRCHFSAPPSTARGRNAVPRDYVPDTNLPDRDYVVIKKTTQQRILDKRTVDTEDAESEHAFEDDDGDDDRSSTHTSQYETIMASLEVGGATVTDPQPDDAHSDLSSEPAPKKAKKSRSKARKSTRDDSKPNELLFFSPEFLEDLAPDNIPNIQSPPNLNLFPDLNIHKCEACGFQFVLESSLDNHLARHVLDISYMCTVCKEILTFNNRCTFLNHCLMHEPRADRDYLCRKASVKSAQNPMTLPMNLSLEPYFDLDTPSSRSGTPSLTQSGDSARLRSLLTPETRDGADVEQTTLGTSVSSTAARGPDKPETATPHPESTLTSPHTTDLSEPDFKDQSDPKAKCPECEQIFLGFQGMVAHFGSQKRPNPTLRCHVCGMIMSSLCSLKAHVRSHEKKAPFVCFICACVIDERVFERHLQEKCLAYSRWFNLDCSSCHTTIRGLTDVYEHLIQERAIVRNLCLICNIVYNDIGAHIEENHPNSTNTSAECLQCPLCTVISKTKRQLLSHLDCEHLESEIIPMGSFQHICQVCETKPGFPGRKALLSHYRSNHRDRYRPYLCNECDHDGGSATGLAMHMQCEHDCKTDSTAADDDGDVAMNVCPVCEHECENNDEVYKHRHDHAMNDNKFWCLVCRDLFTSKQALIQHERICTRARDEENQLLAYLCDFCTDTFLLQDELDQHVQQHHHSTRFPCGLCGLTYDNEDDLIRHSNDDHSREKKKQPYTCQICERRGIQKCFSAVVWLKRHIQIIHKGRSSQVIPDETEKKVTEVKQSESTDVRRLKRGDETTFFCAKCDYQTEDRDVFKQHIQSHKSTGIQCPDCGLSFVSELSLRTHLIMVHRIRDVESYMVQNSVGEDQRSCGKNGYVGKDPLDCTVCSQHFDDPASLKTHLRSHGMAFICSQSSRSAKPTAGCSDTNPAESDLTAGKSDLVNIDRSDTSAAIMSDKPLDDGSDMLTND